MLNVKYEDANHDVLLINLGWLNIRNMIKLDLGVFMYKTINGKTPEVIKNLFTESNSIHNHNTGTRSAAAGNLHVNKTNLTITKRAISSSGVKCWNEIPFDIRNKQSIESLKVGLRTHLFENQMTCTF